MTAELAVAAITIAAALRDLAFAGVIVHTDRGSQFRSRKFMLQLKRQKMVGSIGRVGAAGDKATAESFFSLLQKNVLDRQRRLGKLTPIEPEAIHQPAQLTRTTGGLTFLNPNINQSLGGPTQTLVDVISRGDLHVGTRQNPMDS
jgi:transposase InsO family protein